MTQPSQQPVPQQQPRLLSSSEFPRGHAPVEPEQCLILRLPEAAAERLRCDIETGASVHERLSIEARQDLRHFSIAYDGETLPGRLVDLPCIIEAHKTADSKTFYKVANISQMLLCRAELDTDEEESERRRRKPVSVDRAYQWDHGLTPPLKNARRRRFRKARRNKFMDMPELEKEVKRLLRSDIEAFDVKLQVLTEEEAAKLELAAAQLQEQQPIAASSQYSQGGGGGGNGGNGGGGFKSIGATDEEGNTLKATELFGDISDSSASASDSSSDENE